MTEILVWITIFLFSVMIHEVSHGLVAYAYGDTTAKDAGRLSLNPLRHIDLFWTVLLPALLFISTQGRFMIGMAKPVPVNFARLHEPKQGMIWVGLAGPLANVLLAMGLGLIWKTLGHPYWLYAAYFNVGLAVFNMIPIPPLDGSRVVAGLLPARLAAPYLRIEQFGFLIILFLYFTRVLLSIMIPGMDFLCQIVGIPSVTDAFSAA